MYSLFPKLNGFLWQARSSPQQHQRSQRPPQQQQQQPASISSFAYNPTPLPPPPQAIAPPPPGHAGTDPGAASQWQQQPQRRHRMGGGAGPEPSAGTVTHASASAGTTAPGSGARPAARSWDDVSRQRGQGRHASTGMGRPAATVEPPGNNWALGGVRQRGDNGRSGRFEAGSASNGGHAGERGRPPFAAPGDGYGGSSSGGRGEDRRDGGTTTSFFDGGESRTPEGKVKKECSALCTARTGLLACCRLPYKV